MDTFLCRRRTSSFRLAQLIVLCLCVPLAAQRDGQIAQEPRPPGGRDHDARLAFNQGYAPPSAESQLAAIDAMRRAVPELAVTIDPATGATRTMLNRLGYLTARDTGRSAVNVARDFVLANLDALGLSPADLEQAETTDVVPNRATGSTHLYLRQRYRGLPVYNGLLQVNVNRDGRVMSVNNAFQPNLAAAVNALEPSLSAEAAVGSAARQLGLSAASSPQAVGAPQGARQATRVEWADVSLEPMNAQLMLLPIRRDDVRLIWNFQIHTVDQQHVYDLTVDAVSGDVWTRVDWVATDVYQVYPQPVESPNHTTPVPPADARVNASNPANATASPYGWHDTNGVAGPEFTIMRGNNAHAYDDIDANGAPPAVQPDCGPSLQCSFAVDLTQEPHTYTSAAVANLFYWNNIVHDIQYQYGFTEAAGNFQVNNYGKGGLGNDDVRAEAQDGGGTNNANFFTPSDGSRPRMQMYLWTSPTPDRDGDFDAGIVVHEYGHGISNRLVGGPSNVSCLQNTQQPGEGLSDWWTLVYTAKTGDVGTTGRGIGTYALGQPTTGPGIRTQRYSTDPAINTWTYASINGMVVPHGVGSVWAQAAWEMYWALVDVHGFSANLYNANGTSGNQRAMLYVNEGLQNSICSPAFTDVRDGIIQAATDNHGGEDVCRLWTAFAAFGLGVDAVSGGSSSTSPTNGFAIPCACQPGGCPSLSINDVSVTEGNSGTKNATFTVSLSAASSATVSVGYATADGTARSDTQSNTGSISIPSSGAGTPYPSTITVASGLGALSKAVVILRGFNHTWPNDVDVLLVGPGGQSVLLMSDVGSSIDASNLTFTFDDTGPALGTGALASGTYKPTNYGTGDTFPASAPSGPYGSALSVFNGTDPAGAWRLFVVDDVGGDSGSFSGGWSLKLQTATPSDYQQASGTLTFAPGSTAQNIPVVVNGDTTVEPSETFVVNLSNATNATIGDAQGQATILNDDAVFTDDPMTAGSTVIKAVHITELRTRINTVRAAKGLAPFSWTDPTLTVGSTLAKATHVIEMRTALAQAYVAAGQSPPTYTDPALAAGMAVRAVHIAELRAAVVALQ